jgi:hypothetical protein
LNRDWTYVWVMSLKNSFINWENVTARQMIKRWLIRWMIDDWIETKVLFWSLNVWITNLNFSNAFSISECLISFTKRKLKIRTSVDTFLLLIDMNISFFSKFAISFCLNAMNDDTTDSAIVLKMKLTINAKNFLNRLRSRLIDSMNIIESIMRFCHVVMRENRDDL